MNWFRENGGLIGLISVASIAVGVFAELRIRQHLAAMDIPSDDRIAALDTEMDSIKDNIGVVREQHNDDRDRMDGKIERIVTILLEE